MSVVGYEARGLPSRALILRCEISNPNPGDLYIADGWLEIRGAGGVRVAEGRLFHPLYNMVDPAVVSGGGAKKSLGDIVIPLSSSAIQLLEERRNGGDLPLQIDSRILVAGVITGPDGHQLVLSAPIESRFSSSAVGGSIELRIPQSEWVKLLRQLEWSEMELMELPMTLLRSEPRLARARDRLKEAESCLTQGDWDGVLQNCRMAWEAAAIGLTGEESHRVALPKLAAYFGKGPKAEQLDSLAKKLGEFLHLARHDQPDHVSITRADAVLGLRITASLLDYIARR